MKFSIFNFQFSNKKEQALRQYSGQAALIAVIFMLGILLSLVFGVASLAMSEARVAEKNLASRHSYFAAEAGIEDAMYRLKSNKILSSTFTVSLGSAEASIIVDTPSAEKRIISASGDASEAVRNLRAEATIGTQTVNFFYGLQVGDGGLQMSNNAIINGNVYSNGNITGNNGVRITGDAVVAGGINASPSVEWNAQDSNLFFATASSNIDAAQSFTANASDRLNKVSVFLGKVGNPSGNITIKIANDNGGKPATGNIASATIANSLVGVTPSWIDIAFPSPPNLTSGTKYWVVLDYGSSNASNYWNWKKDGTDGYANNTGKYTSNCCSGNPTWTNAGGDLDFRAWIGGTNTKIESVTVGSASSGTARANIFTSTTVHGSACPNQYCIIDNPPRAEMPIPDGMIQDWKDEAAAGGTINGDYTVSDSQSLGPKKITGNLNASNGATINVTGTIWVVGDVDISNGSIVKLASSYGTKSGVLITDNIADIHNNAIFQGSGQAGSYVMLLSTKNAPASDVIEVDNGSTGVIYYAANGRIRFHNNAAAKEAIAYGIDLDNNSVITYESGLANVNFASGPSGGWEIDSWKEVQ
ncbi:hypothetical protein HYT01_01520 [Candidatus Giovannonibacteria bacterium]|nr:hypothetical protein [Candidatus Giovannonibacteria bacterium]